MKNLTRRSFLKMTGAAAAATTLSAPLAHLPAFAQEAELSVQTWGHFISSLNPLMESLTADWGAKCRRA